MAEQILISTSSFATDDPSPLMRLKELNMRVVLNPYGRKLTDSEIIQLGQGASGIIAGTENLSGNILRELKSLKVISRCGAGMDNVDLKAAQALGIKIFNTPSAPVAAVAELTVGLMFDLLRQISLSDRALRQGKWQKKMGALLRERRVGIVGYGQVGREVGRLCLALGAEVSFCDPFVAQTKTQSIEFFDLTELISRSDIVTLHVSYSVQNRHLIGEKELAMFKKSAILINCARGEIVDEQALWEALKNGKMAGAAFDVFEQEPYQGPLSQLENVVLTPHIGSYAVEARVQMEKEAVDNLVKGLGIR